MVNGTMSFTPISRVSCHCYLLTRSYLSSWFNTLRTSYGNILLDYYRATGKVEYLERGIAVLRAKFLVSPSKNWAHVGYGGKAGVSSSLGKQMEC